MLGIDVLVLRIIIVALALLGGSGVVLYAIAWLLVPEEGRDASDGDRLAAWIRGLRPGAQVALVVAAGIAVLVVVAGPLPSALQGAWIVTAIIAGGVVAWLVTRTGSPQGGHSMSTSTAPPAPPQQAPAPPAAPPSILGPVALSTALIVVGALTALTALDIADIPTQAVLGAALGVLAIALVVGAFTGHARWLLWIAVPLAAILALASAPTTSTLSNLATGSAGDRTWVPTAIDDTVDGFALGVGTGTLDLTELDLPQEPAAVIPIAARIDMGTLAVIAPEGVHVRIDATAGMGAIEIDGSATQVPAAEGVAQRVTTELPGSVEPLAPTLVLDLSVGMGTIEVAREGSIR